MAALLDFTEQKTEAEILPVSKTQADFSNIALKESVMQSFGDQSNHIITIDPNDCILWPFSDRPSDELGDIESLAKSLKEHGQQEPILVRENRQNTPHRYEIIFGNRRWRAAHFAHISVIAICKNISDQEASLCQKEENENRKELSDYARAMSYRAQIDGGVYRNETELSKFLGISKQALNDLMAYLRVPDVLRNAISHYKNLSKKMAIKLAVLSKNSDYLDVLLHLAPKISDQTITTTNIDQRVQSFLSPGRNKKAFLLSHPEKRDPFFQTQLKSNGEAIIKVHNYLINQKNIDFFNHQLDGLLKELVK